MMSLDGYVAVITGASSGVGAAAARAILDLGGSVVAGARRADRVAELLADAPDRWRAIEWDVRNPRHAREAVDRAVADFGRVDALIASAGIGMYGGILDHAEDDLVEMLDTNIAGTVWPVRATVRALRRQGGGGDIVIISSVAGLRGRENEAVYAATKHAQVGLAGGLDRELHTEGIRVTALCPGGIVTEFAMGAGRTAESPELALMMTAQDVADQIVHVITAPKSVRSLVHSFRGVAEPD
jgi:Short-chain alcohol dehydrogenase of unknown specificity